MSTLPSPLGLDCNKASRHKNKSRRRIVGHHAALLRIPNGGRPFSVSMAAVPLMPDPQLQQSGFSAAADAGAAPHRFRVLETDPFVPVWAPFFERMGSEHGAFLRIGESHMLGDLLHPFLGLLRRAEGLWYVASFYVKKRVIYDKGGRLLKNGIK